MRCHGAPRLLAASVLLALALALPVHSQGILHTFPTSRCGKAELLHDPALVPYQSAFGWSTCLAGDTGCALALKNNCRGLSAPACVRATKWVSQIGPS